MNDKTKKIIDGIKDETKGRMGQALIGILVASIVNIAKNLKDKN